MFKVGDKVRCVSAAGAFPAGQLVEGAVYEVAAALSTDVVVWLPSTVASARWREKRFVLVEESAVLKLENYTTTSPLPVEQAMRFNNSKSDLAYFLTFDGGVDLLFLEGSGFRVGAQLLAEWYRVDGDHDYLLNEAIDELVAALDPAWPEAFASVCTFGAVKYARGNYLKGRGLHDTCNSLLRHMLQELRGEKIDQESGCTHEGHIAWNLLFLRHCWKTFGDKFDDRIRAPKGPNEILAKTDPDYLERLKAYEGEKTA